MTELSTAERRAYQQLCDPDGRMLVIACDQRGSMRSLISAKDGAVSRDELADVKVDLLRYLGNLAPSVLLDPEYALPRVIDNGVLARDVALLVGMDGSGWDTDPRSGLRVSRLVEGITARRVRQLGGTAAKLLVYMRPDREGVEDHPARLISQVLSDCAAEDLLLVVEILTYRLEAESAEQYAQLMPLLVPKAALLARECGAKVLKLPFAGTAEGCAAVTRELDGIPWALLSAGVEHAMFLAQLKVAMDEGASGAIAGRSLWKDCLSSEPVERRRRLSEIAVPRLREVQALLSSYPRDRTPAPVPPALG